MNTHRKALGPFCREQARGALVDLKDDISAMNIDGGIESPPTEEEVKAGSTGAVAHAEGTSKLNATTEWSKVCMIDHKVWYTDKSPGVMLCLATNGFCSSIISSTPIFAWKLVSMSSNTMIEPSAPPLQYYSEPKIVK